MTKEIIPAKTCYSHLGGKLGELIFNNFIGKGWIKKENKGDKHFHITKEGEKAFTKMGIDLSQIKKESL